MSQPLDIPVGLEHALEFVVDPELQTNVYGTLPTPVLASPAMIQLMERVAVFCVADRLPEGHTTVGFEVCVRHVARAPAGASCVARAVLREIDDGRKLRFDVSVEHDARTIGVGTHERRLVAIPAAPER